MPPLLPPQVLNKAKKVTIILFAAMALLLFLYTVYVRIMNSENLFLIVSANLIIFLLWILYRRTSTDETPHAPLFSFPSLSIQTPSYSLPNLSMQEPSLEQNLSLHEHVVKPPPVHNDEYIHRRSPSEWAANWRSRERSEGTSIMSGEEKEVIKMVVDEKTHEDQENLSNESMDETWKAILAKGKAKPVRRLNNEVEIDSLKKVPRMKEFTTQRRKKEKKKDGETSQERETKGWRQKEGITVSKDELSNLSELLIKNQYNRLKIERQESDRRRLLVV